MVGRENDPTKFHTGYYSYATPKLYHYGHAVRAARKLNARLYVFDSDFDRAAYARPFYTKERLDRMEESFNKNRENECALGKYVIYSVSIDVIKVP